MSTNIKDMKLFSYNDMREILGHAKTTLIPFAQHPEMIDLFCYWMDCQLAGKPLDLPPQPEPIVQKPLDKDAEVCDNNIIVKEEGK